MSKTDRNFRCCCFLRQAPVIRLKRSVLPRLALGCALSASLLEAGTAGVRHCTRHRVFIKEEIGVAV